MTNDAGRYARAVAQIEALQILGMRFGTARMIRLLGALGNPHLAQPTIHVVGTNGKTSTTRFAACALRSQGLAVGAYTSPHVIDWTERIAIGGLPSTEGSFADAVDTTLAAVQRLNLAPDDAATQFEVITAAGFVAFASAGVDAAVVEAGLGGRFDASNVLSDAVVSGPRGMLSARRVVALTNISLEHTEILGTTERAIAAEKLAVAPDGFDRMVVGVLSDTAAVAVSDEMAARQLSAWRVGREVQITQGMHGLDVRTPGGRYDGLTLGVEGAFQSDNLAVALAAAERLLGRPLDGEPLRAAIGAERVPGRLERFPGHPDVLVDGAHNPAGIAVLAAALRDGSVPCDRIVAVVSILDDKDASAMLSALAGTVGTVVATRSGHLRALQTEQIVTAVAGRMGAVQVTDPADALDRARAIAGPRGLVVVCGSLYLIGALRGVLAGKANHLR